MSDEIRTIGVLTSGGDAPGMNAAIRAVVRQSISHGKRVLGISRGYSGLIAGEFSYMDAHSVSDIIQCGGTILRTARCKEMMTPEGVEMAAQRCRENGIDGLVVIGGDGSYRGAQKLAQCGIKTIGVPGTIDLDIACTEYTIGFDTAVNTAMQAIDRIRDTSSSHERCSIIEVMGRHAGYIALSCGIANGAEQVILPENYDNDEERIIKDIIYRRSMGKKHYIIINTEGVCNTEQLAKRIEEETGMNCRASILGYMQRGGSPTAQDRVHATLMGAKAVDLLCEGKSNRVVAFSRGAYVDYDIDEALAMQKGISKYVYRVCRNMSKGYGDPVESDEA